MPLWEQDLGLSPLPYELVEIVALVIADLQEPDPVGHRVARFGEVAAYVPGKPGTGGA
jgi:hypothetical protein